MNIPDRILRAIEDATPHYEVRAIVQYLVITFIETGRTPSHPVETPAIMCFDKIRPELEEILRRRRRAAYYRRRRKLALEAAKESQTSQTSPQAQPEQSAITIPDKEMSRETHAESADLQQSVVPPSRQAARKSPKQPSPFSPPYVKKKASKHTVSFKAFKEGKHIPAICRSIAR